MWQALTDSPRDVYGIDLNLALIFAIILGTVLVTVVLVLLVVREYGAMFSGKQGTRLDL